MASFFFLPRASILSSGSQESTQVLVDGGVGLLVVLQTLVRFWPVFAELTSHLAHWSAGLTRAARHLDRVLALSGVLFGSASSRLSFAGVGGVCSEVRLEWGVFFHVN